MHHMTQRELMCLEDFLKSEQLAYKSVNFLLTSALTQRLSGSARTAHNPTARTTRRWSSTSMPERCNS